MKSRFLTLIGAGLAIALAGCSAEELAALNAQMQAAGVQGAQTGTAVTAVGSTTTTINSTVQTIQTVTDMASSVSDMSSSSESLSDSSSTASSGSATNSSSLMGGLRGAPMRQTTSTTTACDPAKMLCPPPPCDPAKMLCPPPPTGTTTTTQPVQPPPPPKPPDPETVCTTTPPAGSYIPCFCVFHKPALFADQGAVTCEEQRPPAPGEGSNFQKMTGTITVVTQEDGCLNASFAIAGMPSDAQVGDDMKKNCTASGSTMSCKLGMLVCPVTAKCQDGSVKTFYNPAQQQQGGPPTLRGRFQFPPGLEPPKEFTKDNKEDTKAWLRKLVDTIEAAKDESNLRALLKTFVTSESGWVTMVNVERCNNNGGKPCPPDPDPNGPKEVKATMIQFGTQQLPPAVCPGEQGPTAPPLMVNYQTGFAAITVDGKVPGIGQISMDVFHAEFERPSDEACTPNKLDGTPLSDSVKGKGRLINGRRAEIGSQGDYFAAGKTTRCQALEAVAAASTAGAQFTPPITYVDELRNDVRQLPKPQANKDGKLPFRYPVLMNEETRMSMVVKPQGLRSEAGKYGGDLPPVPQARPGQPGPGQPGPGPIVGPPPAPVGLPGPGTPPPPAIAVSELRLQVQRPGGDQTKPGTGVQGGQPGQGPGGPGQMMGGCPGEGAGQRTEVITFSDDKTETRVQSFIKKEGQCRPTPIGKDGKPLEITEDDKGNLKTKLKDEATGEEIEATVENPDSENKVVKISAGFVTGSISYHAADENGIIAEGELKVKVLKTEVEVTILLSEAGWQHVRGKVGTSDSKTVTFWQNRTTFKDEATGTDRDGAEIVFALGSQPPAKLTETPDTTGAEATGSINMFVPGTPDKKDCENTGNGVMKLVTGGDSGQELTLALFEDETSIVKTKDGTVANEPLEGCALAKGGTGKATSASTTGQTASSGQATTTGGTTATATAYRF
ncbi:MAG: hypothetical protein HYT87_09850 [Nitrospirae bacterium]|nr:hypothetical protein [Nitrospirota bacterium]